KIVERCDWVAAENLLASLPGSLHRATTAKRAAVLNLRGCCSCMTQDFEHGLKFFTEALKLAGEDARIEQNLALTYEWLDQYVQADRHWERYLGLLRTRV